MIDEWGLETLIEVDGGVNTENAASLFEANFFTPARSACVRTEQRLVLTRGAHCSDGLTVEAVGGAHAVIARTEVEEPRAAWVARAERTRPVVAVRANVAELVVPTAARSGQEEDGSVLTFKKTSVYPVPCLPRMLGVLVQFLPLLLGGHAPATSPIRRGRIIP